MIHGGEEQARGRRRRGKGGLYLVDDEELLAVHIHLKKGDAAHLSGKRRLHRPQSHEL